MTILDTFYLLFKSDAPAAGKEVDELDKKISSLAAKGKLRNESEIKELKELRKQRSELTRDIKDQTRETDKLGEAITSTIEGAASAALAVFSLSALKSGVVHAIDFNSALQVQAKLTGQNVTEMLAYAAAVEKAGGSKEAFLSFSQQQFSQFAASGLPYPGVTAATEFYRKQLKNFHTPHDQELAFQRFGISDPGHKAFLLQSDAEYEKNISNAREFAKVTKQQADNLRELKAAGTEAGQAIDSAFTQFADDLSLVLTPALHAFAETLKSITNSKTLSEISFNSGADLADWLTGKKKQTPPSAPAITSAPGSKSAYEFWLSQGYSPAQAAGLAANEHAESGGNPNARNFQKGTHFGLYQWEESRRQAIIAGTGIDVANASAEQQRTAAAWEIRRRREYNALKSATSPGQAAAIVNEGFEVSGESSFKRAQIAAQIAQQHLGDAAASPLNSQGNSASYGGDKSVSIKTGDISVHTQATDANGIAQAIAPALETQFKAAVTHWDDAIAY